MAPLLCYCHFARLLGLVMNNKSLGSQHLPYPSHLLQSLKQAYLQDRRPSQASQIMEWSHTHWSPQKTQHILMSLLRKGRRLICQTWEKGMLIIFWLDLHAIFNNYFYALMYWSSFQGWWRRLWSFDMQYREKQRLPFASSLCRWVALCIAQILCGTCR